MVDGFIKRKIMRLDKFDYSQAGPYFLTLCVFNKQNLFGFITPQGDLELSPAGTMVKRTWQGLPEHIPGLVIDEFIVMPDHLHAIIGFIDERTWRAHRPATTESEAVELAEIEFKVQEVSDIVRRFKNQTQREYRRGVNLHNWKPYQGRLWQRGFWDRIIRNEKDLQAHREYIYNNATKWHLDHNIQ